MIPNPIHKVLSIFQSCGVRALLMGGQACVFYGGAEFSRDTDFAIQADPENLARLEVALLTLQAVNIAVPPLSLEILHRGHAAHFRCRHPEAAGLRIDIMARMRGVDDFECLWNRRTTLEGPEGTRYELMSLPDLVRAKKTQRDKDWPMIRRLIEADHAACTSVPTPAQIDFWLRECRTPEILVRLAEEHPEYARDCVDRPVVKAALAGDIARLEAELQIEESTERALDRAYWIPLRRELEAMRLAR